MYLIRNSVQATSTCSLVSFVNRSSLTSLMKCIFWCLWMIVDPQLCLNVRLCIIRLAQGISINELGGAQSTSMPNLRVTTRYWFSLTSIEYSWCYVAVYRIVLIAICGSIFLGLNEWAGLVAEYNLTFCKLGSSPSLPDENIACSQLHDVLQLILDTSQERQAPVSQVLCHSWLSGKFSTYSAQVQVCLGGLTLGFQYLHVRNIQTLEDHDKILNWTYISASCLQTGICNEKLVLRMLYES